MKTAVLIFSSIAFGASVLTAGGDLASLLVPLSQMAPAPVALVKSAESSPLESPAATEAAAPTPSAGTSDVYVGIDDLLPDLCHLLEEQYAADGGLSVEVIQPWKSVRVNSAAWRLELLRVSGQELASRIVVSFRILCGDQAQGDYQIQLACKLKRDVMVARRHFNRGEGVTEADFELQTRDVLELPVLPMTPGSNLSQYETRSALGAGQVLYWRDVEVRPTIRRGQVVDAIATEGMLRIAVKALVLEDGREGEFINVRNLSSNKDIQARILNDRTVQVYF